jgi:polyphosphate kinase
VLDMFRSQIFPVLTPLAVDPGHPFPHLANKSLNVAVVLRRPGESDLLFAVVQVPPLRPRLVELPRDPDLPKDAVELVSLETVIRLHLGDLFHGMEIADSVCFRVTRDSEFELEEEEVDDLLRAIEENVKQRRRGHPVRLEVEATAPAAVVTFLTEALGVAAEDVTRAPGALDLTMLFQVHALAGFPQLRDAPALPTFVKEFPTPQGMWAAIRARDILVHHPYESSSISSTPRPTTTTSTPSSRPSTAPAPTARSSRRCSGPPTAASR